MELGTQLKMIQAQRIIPAARKLKDLEKLWEMDYKTIILLDSHINQLKSIVGSTQKHGKRILVHLDLVQGLKSDEFGAEFVSQTIRPDGVITTRGSTVPKIKQNKLISVQRMFLLDSSALQKAIRLVEKTKPDVIEVLPGVIPHMIEKVHQETRLPVIAGGLIETQEQIEQALEAGAAAVTTSRVELWKAYHP
ncbi:glycerol-3-phosphate responsive antiterminator [Marinicrinis sediminis]|uniref:Glycerol uptake operon antiterminator regulatory protein n=1 Tax=Marinicrinis sediminis TaxID=1652465 RepID=A0ABW5R843_9BACL